jgi:hypothetical protein
MQMKCFSFVEACLDWSSLCACRRSIPRFSAVHCHVRSHPSQHGLPVQSCRRMCCCTDLLSFRPTGLCDDPPFTVPICPTYHIRFPVSLCVPVSQFDTVSFPLLSLVSWLRNRFCPCMLVQPRSSARHFSCNHVFAHKTGCDLSGVQGLCRVSLTTMRCSFPHHLPLILVTPLFFHAERAPRGLHTQCSQEPNPSFLGDVATDSVNLLFSPPHFLQLQPPGQDGALPLC